MPPSQELQLILCLNITTWELFGSAVVKTLCFHCYDLDSLLGQGTKILQATQHNWKKKKKKYSLSSYAFLIKWTDLIKGNLEDK